jgi:thermostable 8-oxoguanine DNA glycosylase
MKLLEGNRKMQFVCWSVGASAFANSVGFFGIAYFDQTIMMWYVLLAIISSMETWAQENIIDAETIDYFQLPQSL